MARKKLEIKQPLNPDGTKKDLKQWTEDEAGAYMQSIVDSSEVLRRRFEKHLSKSDELIGAIAVTVDKYPVFFYAGMDSEIENDMFKFLISEDIKKKQALLHLLELKEDEVGFPYIHKYYDKTATAKSDILKK